MPTVEVSDLAKFDLKEIHSYIAEDDIVAADRLADELIVKFRFLAEQPLAGRLRTEFGRDINCRSFPYRRYLIFYVPIQDGIEIIRVLHSARDVESEFEM